MKDKSRGIPCVAREKIDSFTEEDWKLLEEDEKMFNTVSTRIVVFSLRTHMDCS